MSKRITPFTAFSGHFLPIFRVFLAVSHYNPRLYDYIKAMQLPFLKMNGAGNDFVIFDARQNPVRLTPQQVRKVAARDNTVTKGCDQVIVMEPSKKADAFMRIYNADGGEVDACGNATRCVAEILESELGKLPVSIQTNAGILQGVRKDPELDYILVDMGKPKFDWQHIPLAMPLKEAAAKVEKFCNLPKLGAPAFVSMGNPHVVFFLSFTSKEHKGRNLPIASADVASKGAALERYKEVFPEGVNVSFAALDKEEGFAKHIIYAKVWERGAGLTKSCGTAACAMLAAANARDSNVREAIISFDDSHTWVKVEMDDNGHILLGGFTEIEFQKALEL